MEFVELQRGDAKARWVRRRNIGWWDNLESLWRNRFPIIIPCHQHLQAGGHCHQLECQGGGAHLRQPQGCDGRQQSYQVRTDFCVKMLGLPGQCPVHLNYLNRNYKGWIKETLKGLLKGPRGEFRAWHWSKYKLVLLRGGVPICWPSFGPWSEGPQHGFARSSVWSVEEEASTGSSVTMQLGGSELWPGQKFSLRYKVSMTEF